MVADKTCTAITLELTRLDEERANDLRYRERERQAELERKIDEKERKPKCVDSYAQTDALYDLPPCLLLRRLAAQAIEGGNTAMIAELLPALGCSWEPYDAIMSALKHHQMEALDMIFQHFGEAHKSWAGSVKPVAHPDHLLQACRDNFEKGIHYLLAAGCEVNYIDPETRMTPLGASTLASNVRVCKLLLEAKADPEEGRIPCLVIAIRAHWKIDDLTGTFLEGAKKETILLAAKEAEGRGDRLGVQFGVYLEKLAHGRIEVSGIDQGQLEQEAGCRPRVPLDACGDGINRR